MDRIICLVGESGSGKTTIARQLEQKGYNVIQSYTTRPPRELGEWGHIFTGDVLWCFPPYKQENVVAYTYYNGNHYWATKEQYQGKGDSIYIIDPVGVKKLKETVKDAEIIVIYIKTDTIERHSRMIEEGRELLQVNERIAKDAKEFEKIYCDWCVDNNKRLDYTIKLIKEILEYVEG